MEYANYHKHDHVSSIMTPDTHIKQEEYCKRAVELGHTTYFTTNHGTGGDIFEANTLCEKYGLKCIFGIEAYIVKDPLSKDKRNYHIIIIPRTDKARKKVNLITSKASATGFYYKPRISPDDLCGLDKDDLYITTACVAGIIRDDEGIVDIFKPLVKHFQNNVFLEIQSHNVECQKDINQRCKEFADTYGLELIAANDSHYIYPEQAKDRIEYLKGKNISYGEEDDFILDYPDYDTMFSRFQKQGIFTDSEIETAIKNTMIFADVEPIKLDREIKMPSIYKDLSPEQKIAELKRHVNEAFKKAVVQERISADIRKEYIQGIRDEMKVIEDTSSINTADYFLFNERNTDLAVNKYGGVLTRTGRGSCGSFYINHLLGMTQLDRFTSPVKLYPQRFMSTARLLENRALPDIDFNVVSQEPFVKASRKLLGKDGCYPMVAYGTMKESEAFRNVCRSHKMEYSEFNDVAQHLEEHLEDEKWKPYIEESKKYVGSIVSASVHPCAFLLLDKNIREELGIVRIGDALCVLITSGEADEYKYLKNDYLVVLCWKLITETFEYIGKPIMPINELLSKIDDNVWRLYRKGLTCTLNQCDSDWATSLCIKYHPSTLRELVMFVASLRPSFNSWRDTFMARKLYTTGSKELDDVLKNSDRYILFQENLMQYFEWLGIAPAESIGLIKKISKKKIHQEDFDALENSLRDNWIKQTGSEKNFKETWALIQSCISYGFAAPHALAVAIDSLYGAYLKANYPLEYYTVCLNNYIGDEARTARLTKELEAFGISIKPVRYGYSKGKYAADHETNSIYKGVSSIKYLNAAVADEMYIHRTDSFIEICKSHIANARQMHILVLLGFFADFAKAGKLVKFLELFNMLDGKQRIAFDKVKELKSLCPTVETILDGYTKMKIYYDINKTITGIESSMDDFLSACWDEMPDEDISLTTKIQAQNEYLGYIEYVNPTLKQHGNYGIVTDIVCRRNAVFTVYKLDNGKTATIKMSQSMFNEGYEINGVAEHYKKGDIINYSCTSKPKWMKVNDEWVRTDENELWFNQCAVRKEDYFEELLYAN